LSTLPLAALGQSFYDYYDPNSAGKFGALQVVTTGGSVDNYGNEGASPNNSGHGGNKRYCHSTGHNQTIYNWTNNSAGGYFKDGRNVVECIGEELYCFIEERAQFGQIIGITAGCEQMMNHPAVAIVNQQAGDDINAVHNNYNQEAARGGTNFHGLKSFYGIGGCLSMPAQNGHEYVQQDGPDQTTGTDSANWTTSKWNNYYRFFHGGFGQNQCLRFPKMNGSSRVDSPGNLLPFGVSVCRACCVAEFLGTAGQAALGNVQNDQNVYEHICNYPPDTKANIDSATDGQREELIPRFDMANQAQDFSDVTAANNLFIHTGRCNEGGRARGCSGVNGCAQTTDQSGAVCPY
jgi:hypothetical protein